MTNIELLIQAFEFSMNSNPESFITFDVGKYEIMRFESFFLSFYEKCNGKNWYVFGYKELAIIIDESDAKMILKKIDIHNDKRLDILREKRIEELKSMINS